MTEPPASRWSAEAFTRLLADLGVDATCRHTVDHLTIDSREARPGSDVVAEAE